MKFKVISMTDNNYFENGKLFIETRKRINADFRIYSPDLSEENIQILKNNNIEHFKIDKNKFLKYMQFLKINILEEELSSNLFREESDKYDLISFIDFDTFFINDWNQYVYSKDFDIAYTIRNDMIKKKCLRAFTNGGVIFAKQKSLNLLREITNIIFIGDDDLLIEYDEIWKTLEDKNRPEHKRHTRKQLRWWVDQVISSAFYYKYLKENKHNNKLEFVNYDYDRYKIGFFNCNKFNVLDSKPNIKKEKDIYIRHLKHHGRETLTGKKDIVREKI